MAQNLTPRLDRRQAVDLRLVVGAVALVAVGYLAGTASPFGAQQSRTETGLAMRANDVNGLALFTSDEGNQFSFSVDEIHWDGFDDHCKVGLRHADLPADAPTPAPTQNAGVLDWPTDELAVNRSYTIRKWRPETGEHGEMIVMPCVAAKSIMSRSPMPVVSRSRR